MAATSSPILWQDADRNVTLFDIPRSISAAQGTTERPCSDLLISNEPLQEPYSSAEPKSEKGKANLQNNMVDEELHDIYRDLLQNALESIPQHHDRAWAFERRFAISRDLTQLGKKRKLNDQDLPPKNEATAVATRIRTAGTTTEPSNQRVFNMFPPQYRESNVEKEPCSVCDPDDPRFQTNCSAIMLENQRVSYCEGIKEAADALRIPPYSSFYMGDCDKDSRAFHNAIRHQASEHETRRHFDFILLDPPWPNRSVKRTYQTPGSGYAISGSLDGVYDLLLKTDLDMLMADDCLVGVWITNKQSIRELILGEDGIFDQWGIQLEEEWIWAKTTLHGEPVTPIDSVWRKPYEILLLGRKRRRGVQSGSGEAKSVRRRVIVAVPDLHSRKPCLKELIEPLMPDLENYRALEVFPRHLVAGWWSWGNECTKFNCESDWYRAADRTR